MSEQPPLLKSMYTTHQEATNRICGPCSKKIRSGSGLRLLIRFLEMVFQNVKPL